MITVRVTRNIFSGDYENTRLSGPIYATDLKREIGLPDAAMFRDGKPLDDDDIVNDGEFIIALEVPKGATATLAVLATLAIFAAIVGTAVTISMLSSIPTAKKLQTNPSLRGSTNQARKNEMLPILLGKHRIYPDVAALPYTLYRYENQYLRQLFSFGYRNVSIDRSTIKIGETLLTKYKGYTLADDFSELYSQRCIESSIGLELTYDDTDRNIVERTTASNTWKFAVGIIAPQGISGEDGNATVGFRIEWRVSGDDAWTTAVDESISIETDRFRRMYEVTPPTPGTFDIRVQRTNKESDNAAVVDTIYLDVIQSWTQDSTGSRLPVIDADRFSLLALELKATDQLNGIIDELNAVCTLRARVYTGTGTGPDAWIEGDAVNPASAILYLLTDPYANPKPLSDDEIVWDDFEAFYLYSEEHGFECNAFINNEDYSVEDICSYIAESNLAQIRKAGNRIGIIIDAAVDHFTQLFTPRNAWDFSVQKSFSDDIRYFRIKYVDASLGYVETERTVSLDAEGNIAFDAEIPEDESGTEISLVGVTDPTHAAYVGRQRLREISRQKRTFSWTSDIEGILCVPGDVILLEHDQFSIGLGEGRIRNIVKDGNDRIKGIVLDASLPFESTKVYSVVIRSGSKISESLTITAEDDGRTLIFTATPLFAFNIGDLCAVGEYSKETIKLMVTSIERDQDGACSITAVDYDPSIYEEGEIPPYDPGISKYPDAGNIGSGAHLPDGYVPEGKPGADGGDPISLYQYSSSPDIPPDEAQSLIVWDNTVIAWGGTAFSVETGAWSPEIPYPRPEGKPYLWEKCWSYELKAWQIFCRTSGPAPDFDVSFAPSSYRLSSRGMTKGSVTIRAVCNRRNTDGRIIWTVPEALKSGCCYPIDGDTSVLDIPIPDGLQDLPSFTVVCQVASAGAKSYTLSGVCEGKVDTIYLGVYGPGDKLPGTTAEGDLIIGDHLIIQNESGTRDPYYWNGEEWVIADSDMPISFGFKVLQDSLWDSVKAPSSSTTLSAFNIFAANIGANLLFSYYAKMRNLSVGEGTDFSFDVYDYQNGNKTTPVIRAMYKGKAIFQIDPASGRIFFGEPDSALSSPAAGGFMYDPSVNGGSIVSKNNKIIIDSSGNVHMVDADISGTINATGGSFNGILQGATGFFNGSLNTPSFSAMSNGAIPLSITVSGGAESQYNLLYNFYQDNSLTQKFLYRCEHSANPSIKYMIGYDSAGTFHNWKFEFYEEDGTTLVGQVRRYDDFWIWIRHWSSSWANTTFSVTVYTGDGNVFRFKDLPTEKLGLELGQVWCDASGILHAVTEDDLIDPESTEDPTEIGTDGDENTSDSPI